MGRSTSAVSAQLRKLERQAGTPLVVRSGRGLALTLDGETMLAYARRMIDRDIFAVTVLKTAAVFVVIGFYELTGLY